MSLITRCPACQTTFRVVPDQLRMSEGWARCGQCAEIFDAASSLQEDAPLASGGSGSGLRAGVDIDVDPDPSPEIASESTDKTSSESRSEPVRSTLSSAAEEAMALRTALQEIVAARQNFVDEIEPIKSSGSTGAERTAYSSDTEGRSPQEMNDELAPSFLRGPAEPPKRTLWHKTWVRFSLGLVSLVLSLLLVAQTAVHERDRLATLLPQIKPALESVCSYLGCVVSSLRQIDAVTVESSTLSKIRNDTYRLSLTIRNTAPYELAMPALEFTVTDAQDQAVIRRVLLGSELNLNSRLAANAEWSGAIDLSVRPGSGVERIAGYRVLAFYP